MMVWQPIETAPKDHFLLLCGPSGYTTTPLVFTTGRMCSDYHAGRWIDHANDDLSDWGFEPTHWMPLPDPPGAQTQPAPSVPEGWEKELFCIQHAMAMNNWNWDSDASNDMKRAAYAAVVKLLAVAPEAKP